MSFLVTFWQRRFLHEIYIENFLLSQLTWDNYRNSIRKIKSFLENQVLGRQIDKIFYKIYEIFIM